LSGDDEVWQVRVRAEEPPVFTVEGVIRKHFERAAASEGQPEPAQVICRTSLGHKRRSLPLFQQGGKPDVPAVWQGSLIVEFAQPLVRIVSGRIIEVASSHHNPFRPNDAPRALDMERVVSDEHRLAAP
jgi:hypothetical protein